MYDQVISDRSGTGRLWTARGFLCHFNSDDVLPIRLQRAFTSHQEPACILIEEYTAAGSSIHYLLFTGRRASCSISVFASTASTMQIAGTEICGTSVYERQTTIHDRESPSALSSTHICQVDRSAAGVMCSPTICKSPTWNGSSLVA